MNMHPKTMTIADTVKWSGIGRTKLYELIAANKIEAVKFGARTLVVTETVERFLASLPKLNAA